MNQYFLFREDYMRKHATIQLYLSYRCGFVSQLIDEWYIFICFANYYKIKLITSSSRNFPFFYNSFINWMQMKRTLYIRPNNTK